MYYSTALEALIFRASASAAYIIHIILDVLQHPIVRMLLVEHTQLPPVLV